MKHKELFTPQLAEKIAECERLERQLAVSMSQARQECNDVDDLLEHLGLNVEKCRTECGWLNVPKIINALKDDPPWSSASLTRELNELRAIMDYLESNVFDGKWDGTIGRPKSWRMAGSYRHELEKWRGNTLRDAISGAMGT